jgi:hypothetical protein
VNVFTNKLHSTPDKIYCQLPFVIYTPLSRYSGTPIEKKSVTFTKEYTVGFKRADYDIPKQSWNFFGSQPGHSNCIVEFVDVWGECNTFAVVLKITQNHCTT